MTLVHVGIKPKHKLVRFTNRLKEIHGFHYERFPEGGYRLWSNRMLKKACNKEVIGEERLGDLIYCEYCGEFFNANQFKEKK